jgi:hypothetical protein
MTVEINERRVQKMLMRLTAAMYAAKNDDGGTPVEGVFAMKLAAALLERKYKVSIDPDLLAQAIEAATIL